MPHLYRDLCACVIKRRKRGTSHQLFFLASIKNNFYFCTSFVNLKKNMTSQYMACLFPVVVFLFLKNRRGMNPYYTFTQKKRKRHFQLIVACTHCMPGSEKSYRVHVHIKVYVCEKLHAGMSAAVVLEPFPLFLIDVSCKAANFWLYLFLYISLVETWKTTTTTFCNEVQLTTAVIKSKKMPSKSQVYNSTWQEADKP